MSKLRKVPPLQVLIVEDDPGSAAICKRVVSGVANLEVSGAVVRGEDAIALLGRRHLDLILLDLQLAGMSGLNLLQRLRAGGNPVEVIAMTARRDPKTVQAVIQRGAIDYLVKPFPPDRLRQALSRYLSRVHALRAKELDQEAVDLACASGRVSRRWLPKGLTETGLSSVREALDASVAPTSATEIATTTGLARVTARRYLEYMVAVDQASVEAPPSGPGRPQKLYRTAF
jgi:response regulator of citrate/malate metabolism